MIFLSVLVVCKKALSPGSTIQRLQLLKVIHSDVLKTIKPYTPLHFTAPQRALQHVLRKSAESTAKCATNT